MPEIKLYEKCPKKLGSGPTAKKIFKKINEKEEAVVNFENIEFMSRSFAQEYIFQKYNSKTRITEINMNDSIKKLLEVVNQDFNETCFR